MSGPKYSYTRIEYEQMQMILRELERKLEESRCNEIKQKIAQIKTEINEISEDAYLKKLSEYISTSEQLIPESIHLRELKKLLAHFNELYASEYDMGGNSDFLITVQTKYERKKIQLHNIIKSMKLAEKQLKKEYDKTSTQKKEDTFLNADWNGEKEEYILLPASVQEAYYQALEKCLHEPNFEEIKDAIDSIISNHNIDDEYKINQLKLRIKALAVSKTASAEWIKIIKLQNEYMVLSEKLNRMVTNVPTTLDELEQAVTALYDELKQTTMFEYVNKSLSAVMSELGYDVIGEETLIEQKAEKDYYDFSEHSVINISSSQSGALMFEVMGKDSEHGSKTAVKSDMERFCPDYDKVKAGLKGYGIVLEREKLYEPDEKYVRFVGSNRIKHNIQRRVSQKKGILYNNE